MFEEKEKEKSKGWFFLPQKFPKRNTWSLDDPSTWESDEEETVEKDSQ